MRRRGYRRLWLLAIATACACSFSGATPPAGDADAGGGTDASSTDAAPVGERCGSPAVFIDEFDGPDVSRVWAVLRQFEVTVDGVLTLDPLSSGEASGLLARQLVDLRESEVSIEVVTHFGASSNRAASYVLARAATTFFGFHMDGNNLYTEISVGDSQLHFDTIPLDRANHRFLRLREASGTLHFETSPDAQSWTIQTSQPSPPFVSAARIQIVARDGTGDDDIIRFDGLNRGRDAAPWCKASSFVDAFDDNMLDPRWQSLTASDMCPGNVETSSLAVISISGIATGSNCSIRTGQAFDLSGDQVSLEVEPLSGDVTSFLAVYSLDEGFFGFSRSPNDLLCSYAFDGNNTEDTSFQVCIDYLDAHTHWRIRSAGPNVFLEVSADRASWDLIAERPAPFDLTDVDVEFGNYNGFGNTTGGLFTITHYNLP